MTSLPAPLRAVSDVAEGLIAVAQLLARAAARRRVRPARRNSTLRPGLDTPLWNALVLAVLPHLRRRGMKSNLGRELGLPPQRIHEFFKARTAMPDAERALWILHWLTTRRQPAQRPRPYRGQNASSLQARRTREAEIGPHQT